MEIQVSQKPITNPMSNPFTTNRLTNRVITWAIRDMTPLTKSGYRGNLGSLIFNKEPEYEDK